MSTRSSAYAKTFTFFSPILAPIIDLSFWIELRRGSIASMNRKGDKVSPCGTPLSILSSPLNDSLNLILDVPFRKQEIKLRKYSPQSLF